MAEFYDNGDVPSCSNNRSTDHLSNYELLMGDAMLWS
jgi:hypothetical protein